MQKSIRYSLLLLVLAFWSCKPNAVGKDDVLLARVQEKYLRYSDISKYVTPGLNASDSLQLVQNFVNAWVRNEILVQHADLNLPDSLKDFKKQMDEYRNSLLLFQFKKLYVSQELDTITSDSTIEQYYQEHLSDFELKESIVQFDFIQMDENSKKLGEARELFQNLEDTTINRLDVENFCITYGIDYFTDNEKWIPFNDLLARIPITTYNKAVFLKNNRFIEFKDKPYVYFLHIKDFKVAEEISPLEFERDKIRKILLNRRKVILVENMENALFERAFQQKNFEIY